MKCKICSSEANKVFSSLVMNKYEIDYFKCPSCQYLFTEEPYWLDEAYSIPINLSDTGIMQRNLYNTAITSNILFFLYNRNVKCIDYAGGYGIFTRLMRDIGFDFYWYDPYTSNLVAKGFEFGVNGKADFLTAFEVFEHFSNPSEELKKMLTFSDNILLSTEILPTLVPEKDWWYFGFNHGQHISFYAPQTLKKLGDKFGLNYYHFNGKFHLFTKKKINSLLLKIITNNHLVNRFKYITTKRLLSKTWEDHLKLKLL